MQTAPQSYDMRGSCLISCYFYFSSSLTSFIRYSITAENVSKAPAIIMIAPLPLPTLIPITWIISSAHIPDTLYDIT